MPSATSDPPADLAHLIAQLQNNLSHAQFQTSPALLTKAKLALLHHHALVPSPSLSPQLLAVAQQTLELGALTSIRTHDPAAFTRYYQQLQPFYAIPSNAAAEIAKHYTNQRNKITGLYLILLLSQGDYAGFHTVLEALAPAVEADACVQYPARLESALMEGSYDRVWEETKAAPGELAIFSDILIGTIRDEIASCSEKAYSSVPVANAKNLLFLESEGSVVEFGQERGWLVKDGRVIFPEQEVGVPGKTDDSVLEMSDTVIENTLGYARKLETIV